LARAVRFNLCGHEQQAGQAAFVIVLTANVEPEGASDARAREFAERSTAEFDRIGKVDLAQKNLRERRITDRITRRDRRRAWAAPNHRQRVKLSILVAS
jgi:hypothetical protein